MHISKSDYKNFILDVYLPALQIKDNYEIYYLIDFETDNNRIIKKIPNYIKSIEPEGNEEEDNPYPLDSVILILKYMVENFKDVNYALNYLIKILISASTSNSLDETYIFYDCEKLYNSNKFIDKDGDDHYQTANAIYYLLKKGAIPNNKTVELIENIFKNKNRRSKSDALKVNILFIFYTYDINMFNELFNWENIKIFKNEKYNNKIKHIGFLKFKLQEIIENKIYLEFSD